MEADLSVETDRTQHSNATVLTTVSMEKERSGEDTATTLVAELTSAGEDVGRKEGHGGDKEEVGGKGGKKPQKEKIETEVAVVQETIGEASITFVQVTYTICICICMYICRYWNLIVQLLRI